MCMAFALGPHLWTLTCFFIMLYSNEWVGVGDGVFCCFENQSPSTLIHCGF